MSSALTGVYTMSLSFFDFSRLSPRERMRRGLAGQLSPTFGLDVETPRGQLGMIPLRGLGFSQLGEIITTIDAVTGVVTKTDTVSGEVTETDPVSGITTIIKMGTYPLVTAIEPTVAIAEPLLAPAVDSTFLLIDPLVATAEPLLAPLEPAPILAPAPAPAYTDPILALEATAPLPVVAPGTDGGKLPYARYDYSTLGPGTASDEQVNQFTEYGGDTSTGQQEYASYTGDQGDTSSDVTTVEIAARTRIKTPITQAQAMMEAARRNATKYAPWILGVAATLYLFGKSKR